MKSNSNQVAATAATIIAGINWEKLDGTLGNDVLQQIQQGFQARDAGGALTKWLMRREWEVEPMNLIRLGYPDWAHERLTPGIDEEEAFCDGTLARVEPVLAESENFPYAVYYKKMTEKVGSLWPCVGLQTLLFLSANPSSDYVGKTIIGWKSAISDKHGNKYAPACHFKSDDDGVTVSSLIEWLNFRLLCRSCDHTLKIYS